MLLGRRRDSRTAAGPRRPHQFGNAPLLDGRQSGEIAVAIPRRGKLRDESPDVRIEIVLLTQKWNRVVAMIFRAMP
jgi:hypothetical protein